MPPQDNKITDRRERHRKARKQAKEARRAVKFSQKHGGALAQAALIEAAQQATKAAKKQIKRMFRAAHARKIHPSKVDISHVVGGYSRLNANYYISVTPPATPCDVTGGHPVNFGKCARSLVNPGTCNICKYLGQSFVDKIAAASAAGGPQVIAKKARALFFDVAHYSQSELPGMAALINNINVSIVHLTANCNPANRLTCVELMAKAIQIFTKTGVI